MKRTLLTTLIAATLPMTACVNTSYFPYQGANKFVGTGGALKQVDGIDLWLTGTPNRPYTIIGYIEDDRPGGAISMAGRDKGIAAEAKKYGGDAVICNADNSRDMGTYNTVNLTAVSNPGFTSFNGSGFAMRVVRRESKYFVLKYTN